MSGWGGYTALRMRDAAGSPAAAGARPGPGGADPGVSPSAGPTPGSSVVDAGMGGGALPSAAAGAGVAPVAGLRAAGSQAAGNAGIGVSTGPGKVGATGSVGSGRAGASVRYGPWRCGDDYTWDLGHPVLAKPCHSLGDAVRVEGYMEAAPGVQADISLSVRDADTDEVVAGPYTCPGLMFTDFAVRHTCGPVDLGAPRGRRYVVVEQWQYTGRSLLPGGTARGPVFSW
jgi:hypothetical protein